MSEPAVLAEGLRKRFGETQALDGVDLSVRTGQGARPARPERCRQDDGSAHPHDAASGPTPGGRSSTASTCVAEPMRAKARIGLTGQYAAVDERLTGAENLEHVGRLYHMPGRGGPRARARAARAVRPRRRRRPRRQGLLGWHAASPRHRHEPHRPAVGPVPRRADDRARPAQPPGRVGADRGARRRRHHDAADDAVPRRGRPAGRRDRRHRPRPRSSPRGTSAELKQQVGGDRVDVTVRDARRRSAGVAEALAAVACGRDQRRTAASSSVPVLRPRGRVPEVVRLLDAAGVDGRRRRRPPLHARRRLLRPHRAPPPRTPNNCKGRGRDDRDRHSERSTLDLAPAPIEDIPRGTDVAAQGQLDRGDASPAGPAAQPRAADVRHDPAADVRRPVRLCVRRLGDHADRLHAVRHPRHLHPDRAVQLGVHVRGRGRRPAARGSSTACARCRCIPAPCSSVARSRTSCATSSRSS